jgi:nucleoside phosphorylase
MEIIFAALEFEISGLLKLSRAKKVFKNNNLSIYRGRYACRHFLFVKTGMGKENVSSAFQYVRKSHLKEKKNIGSIYLFGFCGVTNRTRIADIVLYRSLVSEKKGLVFKEKLFYPQNVIESIKKIKKITGADIHFLHAASVSDIVSTDANKKEIEEKFKATAFDMESFFLVEAAKAGSFRVVIIRSISDNMDDPIPLALAKISGRKRWESFFMFIKWFFASKKNRSLFFKAMHNFKMAKKSLTIAFIEIFK